ncbi:MAG: CAP domain-containing protein [Patescibacteria group bacterium]|jgi:hypothetical protein|nr:CAP domain-containing protein [Patescibacteria group bacterium]
MFKWVKKFKFFKFFTADGIFINHILIRFKGFINGQKREFRELSNGQETIGHFLKDSTKLIKDFFIPYEGNSHRPKFLSSKNLLICTILAVIVKIMVSGFLFFAYPSQAELSAIISSNIISLINQSREEAGVEPLTENNLLANFASQKGADMINRDYFAHDTPEGKKPWQWINRGDYDYLYAGENLAMDFIDAETVHQAFMKSPSHRRNILNSKYQDVGIAVLQGDLNGRRTILLVEFFAAKKDQIAPLIANRGLDQTIVDVQNNKPNDIKLGTTAGVSNELGAEVLSISTVSTTNQPSSVGRMIDLIITFSNVFFIGFLIFLSLSLVLNIIIKIKIQHPAVIIQTLAVIALIAALAIVKFNFVENVPHQLIIL